MPRLGNLQRIDPRDVWDHEATDFTPWLSERIEMLGDVLNLELELVQRESRVGDFSVDLLARDLGRNGFVVIENQLEATDHTHLGQLLTYAAGTNAGSVIWLCRAFREEHRQALDWLNEHCRDVDFFGVVVEVLRIDDSAPAVNFRPVAFPNDWSRRSQEVAKSSELSERAQAYQEFFERLLERLRTQHDFTRARKGQPQNWYAFASGHTGYKYGLSFARGGQVRVDLYIDTGDGDKNLEAFERLIDEQETLDREFDESLQWERLEESRACRIATYRDGSIEDSDEELEEYLDWGIDQLLRFKDVFGGRLDALPS